MSYPTPNVAHRFVHNRFGRALTALIALSCVAPLGCLMPTADEQPTAPIEAIETSQEPVVCGAENWNDIAAFAYDDSYRIGAHYGRAVAAVSGGGGRGTGWLFGDRWLITANHVSCHDYPCVQHTENDVTVTASFGEHYGNETILRNRLADLGVPYSIAWNDSMIPTEALTKFTCHRYGSNFNANEGNRDIDFYYCDPNRILYLGDILPGHLYGYIPLAPQIRPQDHPVYMISVAKSKTYSARRVLLSPDAQVHDSDSSCVFGTPYDHCLEHNADTIGGSSGGVLFDALTHRAFAVQSGSFGWDGGYCGPEPWGFTNYSAYLDSQLYREPAADGFRLIPRPTSPTESAWVGGHGGQQHELTCPNHYLAVGVIGSAYSRDAPGYRRVGNFGLICAPYQAGTSRGLYSVSSMLNRQTELLKVIVGGSIDTPFGPGLVDFNTFVNEALVLENDRGEPATFFEQHQPFTMCRPGWFLSGVKARVLSDSYGTFIDAVPQITCTNHTGTRSETRSVRGRLGSPSGLSAKQSSCPSAFTSKKRRHRAAYGLTINSGWLTDGFSLECRRFTK